MKTMPQFDTLDDAYEWMYQEVDDPCIDNERSCWLDVQEEIEKFEYQAENGCCGSFEKDVVIGGRLARIGCNYGH